MYLWKRLISKPRTIPTKRFFYSVFTIQKDRTQRTKWQQTDLNWKGTTVFWGRTSKTWFLGKANFHWLPVYVQARRGSQLSFSSPRLSFQHHKNLKQKFFFGSEVMQSRPQNLLSGPAIYLILYPIGQSLSAIWGESVGSKWLFWTSQISLSEIFWPKKWI